MPEKRRCSTEGCKNEARCAISTSRPTRDDLRSTLHYDDRTAPKKASPYCKTCARALLTGLVAIVENDQEWAA